MRPLDISSDSLYVLKLGVDENVLQIFFLYSLYVSSCLLIFLGSAGSMLNLDTTFAE